VVRSALNDGGGNRDAGGTVGSWRFLSREAGCRRVRRSRGLAAEISKQLRLLEKVVRYRFGDNAGLMGAWESARNPSLRSGQVEAGPFNTTNEPQSGAGAGGSETLREAQGRPPKAA
jgi:hypothetical protein